MLGMICATYLAVTDSFTAALSAAREFGHSRRKSREKQLRPGRASRQSCSISLQSFIICSLSFYKVPVRQYGQISSHIICGNFLYYFRTAHLSQFSSRKHNCQHKCRRICDWSCIHTPSIPVSNGKIMINGREKSPVVSETLQYPASPYR